MSYYVIINITDDKIQLFIKIASVRGGFELQTT